MDDFKRISHVPAAIANLPVGHAARSTNPMAARPHRWQWAGSIGSFRGDAQSAKCFVGEDCGLCKDAQWSLQRKQFPETRGSR